MPFLSPKIYSFIFGFHRLTWWPKCTPASSSSFIVTVANVPPNQIWFLYSPALVPLERFLHPRIAQTGQPITRADNGFRAFQNADPHRIRSGGDQIYLLYYNRHYN